MGQISLTGGTLGAAAAAARLAKLGHAVTLVGDPGSVGGHWRTDLPPVFGLPAAWRDLFRKSGRMLDAELTRHGLVLEPAPAALHRFPDGLELELPAERGAQFATISETISPAAAARWRDLLDDLDDLWLALRRAGLEQPRPAGRVPDELRRPGTLSRLADRVREPHLARIITSLGPRSGTDDAAAPALLATRLVVERTFGRWQLADVSGPVPGMRLLDVLSGRLATRRVTFSPIVPPSQDAVVDLTNPRPDHRLFGPRVRPALAPTVTHPEGGLREVVEHTASGPVVTWAGVRHDFTAMEPDLTWGYAPDSVRSWWARPALASPLNEPWAELSSAALRVYAAHADLTGEDVRPSNRAYRP